MQKTVYKFFEKNVKKYLQKRVLYIKIYLKWREVVQSGIKVGGVET